MSKSVLLLGSNIGRRENYLNAAVCQLNKKAGCITLCSPVFESEPWGFNCENNFLNMAVSLETNLSPEDLLVVINEIESGLGRKRDGNGYQSRTIDIDIIFYDDIIVDTPELTIPHPCFADRRFAILPVREISPLYEHPLLGKTVETILNECTDKSEVYLYDKFLYEPEVFDN